MPPKTVEEKFKKFTQIQHALEKSGMYIGSIENVIESTWRWDPSESKMIGQILKLIKVFKNTTMRFL